MFREETGGGGGPGARGPGGRSGEPERGNTVPDGDGCVTQRGRTLWPGVKGQTAQSRLNGQTSSQITQNGAFTTGSLMVASTVRYEYFIFIHY